MSKTTSSKAKISDQKVIDTLSNFMLPARLNRFEQVVSARTDQLTVVLDDVRNYHNVSAILRSAEAFGLLRVHLVGDRFEYHKGVAKGTERWLELVPHDSPQDALSVLQAEGYSCVVLQAEDKRIRGVTSVPVFDLPFRERLAIVLGNELRGVSEKFLEAARFSAYVPMFGFVESLNVSVAAAICLFCSTIAGATRTRQVEAISEEQQQQLLASWLGADIKGAPSILEQVVLRDDNTRQPTPKKPKKDRGLKQEPFVKPS